MTTKSAAVGGAVQQTRWRRRKAQRPIEILEAALSVFAEKGYAEARMEDIARKAKVSKGTIYLYFSSKEAVFKALAKDMLANEFTRLSESARAHEGRSADLLAETVRKIGRFVSTSNRVVLIRMVIAEARNFPDLARIYRRDVVEKGIELFAALLQRGMASGEFRNMAVGHAVRLCIAPLLLIVLWRTTFAPLERKAYDYESLIEAHVSVLLRGLAPEGAQ